MALSSAPFSPSGSTVNIDVAATTANVALGGNYNGGQLRIMNNGTATVWVNIGSSSVTAALATGFPVGPGVTEVLSLPSSDGASHVAAIAAGSTGKIYFTPGTGI